MGLCTDYGFKSLRSRLKSSATSAQEEALKAHRTVISPYRSNYGILRNGG